MAYKYDYKYYVGGTVQPQSRSYVKRQADQDLYDSLEAGDFCYVLNSRQMGKSSLLINVMRRLEQEGFACVNVDLSVVDGAEEQWYAGIIDKIASHLKLDNFNINDWQQSNPHISPLQRFSKFIAEVLLKKIDRSRRIVIFLDEIDSTIRLKYSDDFFAAIRECYNRRADNSEYRRLSFVLLGVCTPGDLIKDIERTPFNVGKAIDLTGFTLEEVRASRLAEGLGSNARDPQELIRAVLDWTGGQPFLTQKVCEIIQKSSPIDLYPNPNYSIFVGNLVKDKIIDNWETKDSPEHLQTIRDRLLNGDNKTGKLLSLYQQILQRQGIDPDDSKEQTTLRLTGLVVKRDGKLQIYNRIYQNVFDLQWIEKELSKTRPYRHAMNAWIASDRQDKSRLLRGKALQDALAWEEKGNSLTDEDRGFLRASERFKWQRRTSIAIASIFLAATSALAYISVREKESSQNQIKKYELAALNLKVSELSSSPDQIGALIYSIKTGQKLRETQQVSSDTSRKIMSNIQPVLVQLPPLKRLQGHTSSVRSISYSPDGKVIASGSRDKTIKLWNSDGTLLKTLSGHSQGVFSVSFSPDGKVIASSSRDKTIKLWTSDGILLKTLVGNNNVIRHVKFSPDGDTILGYSERDDSILLWSLNDTNLKPLKTWKAHKTINSVVFSRDGKTIASLGSDGISSVRSDDKVKLWSSDGKFIKEIDIPIQQQFHAISFTSDDRKVILGGDSNIIFMDLNYNLLKIFEGNINRVDEIIFSPDLQKFASISDLERFVKIWKPEDGTLIGSLAGHKDIVRDISFSPDGKILASASDDKSVILWDLSDLSNSSNLTLDNLLSRGCKRLKNDLKPTDKVTEEDRHICDNVN